MPRQARLDAPGTLHHVILRGIEKKLIAENRKDRLEFVERMNQAAVKNDIKIFAWALMPNHAHILLKSGKQGLSKYMRRFLTGYAINYNKRHNRYGHLFQNRYKSIVCDEEAYFLQLVRYIHLNPLRAKLVKNLAELDQYAWCGHYEMINPGFHPCLDRKYVLAWFDKKESEALKRYKNFLKEGLHQGQRPELVGGGLVRTMGNWSAVASLRQTREKQFSDERVLGNSDFTIKIIKEADEKIKYQIHRSGIKMKVLETITNICNKEGITIKEISGGSRRGRLPQIRSKITIGLIKEYGLPLAEIGRQIGISTSAVSRIVSKNEKINHNSKQRPIKK
ncbi:MAG: hypothetical protein EHM45_02055 [Desulfobacteraceae bacterium]|nr:MAG: hypothetical protein EHM45_02055 [Desulfobacteraceae bacterium]